ncbi:meiosis-specific coiled-coil domain-containing protein MEIOC [Siniperca chuatsi]|uniref:meiosis-specific coiled-coil domain-containing protein MEIOC n=1 Tax=Siniperca chuatsi TaxID=119488 RepID=UPI001CE10F65|nr:meiosis-specific coiled-coil domain-containing protein MEIOC [Siniperca chuatsi]XP_044036086.1 meiosis-specific coiled-coil domain-containing protein MEIOC [Siniperca chuatsi]
MAFDGHQSTFANSLFPTYQRQASVNVDGGNNGSVPLPFVSVPSVSLQEQDTASYVPWSYNPHDDPFGLINCAQSSIKSRKPTDNPDCDGETDLQGLVSNILDEADSQDSYYSERSLPTCNPVWSPKTLREELIQYFQSEAKTQHNPTFPPNYVSCEALSKVQGLSVDKDVEECSQQSNGLATNQQWLFNLPNRDRDSYTLRPQKLPPGLPMPNIGNTYLSQIQQSKYDNMSADRDRGNSQPVNNFPDLSDVFRPQIEMNSPCFHPYYEDHYIQSSTKPISNEQYVPQDINQLVSSFQSFMAGEHDSLCRGDFPNMHRQTVGMHHEDSMVEQWKITSPAMSTQSSPAMWTQKQLVGEFGTVQMERNGGVRKQTFKRDAFQDQPGFSPQNTEYLKQPKPFSASLKLPNQYQSKMTMHRENTSLPINMSMNQYSKHHIQQGQIQSKIKSQMQKEKMRMHMSGCLGEGFSTRPLTNTNMRVGDKKQVLSQNPYFDHLGSMRSQRFDGETTMVSAGITQQLMPLLYPVNDHRRHSSVPINSSNFSSRSTLPYGSGVPGMDVGDVMSANECAAFSDMMTRRGENTYHGMSSAMTSSMGMNQGGPVIQLYFYLDECYEQWRCLEKERKRTEVILTKTFVGKRTTAVTNTDLPKTPPNPTRVDHLIVNQMREQARVASLLDRMECLYNISLDTNIHTALNRHHMAICITQARRKEEIASMSEHQRQRAHFTEDRDTLLLAIALKDLAATTRKLRTALWCALQMTLPKPINKRDHHVNREATHREGCSSPFEGYSFKL